MKSSDKSTDSQQKPGAKDAFIAFLALLFFVLLLGLSSSVSGYDFDKQSELSAHCKSLGGEIGNDKCFKDGKKV